MRPTVPRLSVPRACLLAALLAGPALAEDVLLGRAPAAGGSPALTDGEAAPEGADWRSAGAVVLPPGEAVLFDLGASRVLEGAAVQADNNDAYLLETSGDGATFLPWFRAGPVPGPGLQTRRASLPPRAARWLRLSASGGDGRYSVSELEVYQGSTWGTALGGPRLWPRQPLDVAWTWGLVGAAALLLLARQRAPWRLTALLLGAAGLGALWLARATVGAPADAGRVDVLRGVAAGLAGLALAREASPWPRARAHPAAVLGVLGAGAALGLACFLNLGRPQFFDAGQGRPTWLHHYDLRTYQPIARFFPELRFDGVYAASAMAVAEDRGGAEALGELPLRDLRTHQLTTVRAARAHLEEVRARFTPERWEALKVDLRYFRDAMGEGGFLGSMNDHGGNATPVWFLEAWLLLGGAPASDAVLLRGVLADVALLALCFLGLWRAFGARTALVAMTLFGAVDFYQFGSNWFGAALRHDWLALWALGAWALQRGRHALGGALLAWSALIRAFPALALLCLAVPVGWELWAARRRGVRGARALLATQGPFLRTAAGAAAAAAVLLAASLAVFGVEAWQEWLRKVALLDRENHLNNLSVRTYVTAGTGPWLAAVALAVAVVVATLRGARPATAAVWAVALVPVVFNPANYYLHAVFLLAVTAGEAPGQPATAAGRGVWLALLAMAVGSALTNAAPDLPAHFARDTGVLLTGLAAVAALLGWTAWRRPGDVVTA